MKIVALGGSPRGTAGNTLRLLEAAMEGARETGATVEYYDIARQNIDYCIGCAKCYETGSCILEDDYEEILEAMMDADGFLVASPVYINAITAQLKTLIDRMADIVHCQKFRGKYAAFVTTGGGGGTDCVLEYLGGAWQVFGASVVGGTSAVMAEGEERFAEAVDESRALGRRLAAAIAHEEVYPEQEAFHEGMREHMTALVTAHRDEWPSEYAYHRSRGWIPE
ncbi:iron-sulfur protein [Methanomicrobiaceae archaeon CYW5]|uniref:flavodoxin family protein n=1 Tax=Methanovulcanius yangii TaxID=1789227 RepID=UPI0029C9C64A|nr:flavodoxin family protein [Methanovulcanius yangii]MBT8507429.1 iron-sulfur protein [Methanovulcanius yangii]